MGKRLTKEDIEQRVASLGATLVSYEHRQITSSKGKQYQELFINLICSKGHNIAFRLSNFRKGYQCSKCTGNRKKTLKEIQELVGLKGFSLVTKEYLNNKQKLELLCPRNHLVKSTWAEFQSSYTCITCNGTKRKSSDELKRIFEENNYKVLDEKITTTKSKVNLICPQGHQIQSTYSLFKKGNRCNQCSKYKKKTIEEIKSILEKEDYTLLTTSYKNSTTPLEVVCKVGHKFTTKWTNLQSGNRCAKCYHESQKRDYNEVKAFVESRGFTLVSEEYKGVRSKLELICSKGHTFFKEWDSLRKGQGCMTCSSSNHYKDLRDGRAFASIRARNGAFYRKTKLKVEHPIEELKKIAEPIEHLYKKCQAGEHVDHLVPLSWYNLQNLEELKAAWDIENLRIIPASLNISISNKRSASELAKLFLENPNLIEICRKASRIPRKGHFELALKVLEIFKNNQKELSSSIAV